MARKASTLNKGYWPFLVPGLILFIFIIILPLLMNIGISFTNWNGIRNPKFVGFENYIRLFQDKAFWASFRNNLAMIVAMTIVPTIVGLFLATFLFDYIARVFKRGKGITSFFRAGFYLPQILPVAIAGVVWGWILQPGNGVLNWLLDSLAKATNTTSLAHNWLGDASTALGTVMVIMIWFQIGYPLVIFMAGLQRVDPELLEAASIDGATWLQRFYYITIRIIQPEIFVVVLTTVIAALKVFGPIFVLTRGGPGNATLVPSYFAYQNFFGGTNRVGYGASIATIMTIIIVILTIVFIKMQSKENI